MKSLFEISRSGLRSAERSLSVTSNNVVNADTPGYTRQRVEKSPVGMQKTHHHTGLGVNIDSVNRLRNDMTDVLLNEKRQDMGFMQEKARILEQLETGMASDSGGDIDAQIGLLFDNFSDLSSDPQDQSIRNNIITVGQQMSSKLHDMNNSLNRSSDLTRDSGVKTVGQINELLRDLDSLNASIRNGEAKGNPDFTSLDIQVQKLEELSELVDFESQVTPTGSLEVRIDGVKVLDENSATMIKPEIDEHNKKFNLRLENGKVIESSQGRLGAEIEMYEEGIPDMLDRLDLVAATLVEEFNEVHRSGYGLQDGSSRDFFDPEFTTAGEIALNQDLVNDPRHIAASSIEGEAGNGDVAAEMANMRNEQIVDGRKLIDYSVDLISSPGSQLSSIRAQIETRDSEIAMLETQQEREAGVNIDEELALMIQYQNAYQGSARVMQSAQQMYDTLISIV
jgi:flagellar hook-associated protein 1